MRTIKQMDVEEHASKIVFCEGLEGLTVEQVKAICFLMEVEREKYKEEIASNSKGQKLVINFHPNIAVDIVEGQTDMCNAIQKALDKQWQLLAKTYGIQTTV